MRTPSRFLCPLFCLLLVGCGSKVHEDLNGEVSMAKDLIYNVDGPKKAQKVKIVVSSDEPVSVFVVLKKEFSEQVETSLTGASEQSKLPTVLLGKSFKAKAHDFEVEVPAKEELTIQVTSRKTTKVNVKVDSQ